MFSLITAQLQAVSAYQQANLKDPIDTVTLDLKNALNCLTQTISGLSPWRRMLWIGTTFPRQQTRQASWVGSRLCFSSLAAEHQSYGLSNLHWWLLLHNRAKFPISCVKLCRTDSERQKLVTNHQWNCQCICVHMYWKLQHGYIKVHTDTCRYL